MITRINASFVLAWTLSSVVCPNAHAFSSSRGGSIQLSSKQAFSISSRPPSTPSTSSLSAIDSEDDALWLLHKAEECADSDSCSIDDARGYLREVVHIQSGCVTGTLAGRNACDDVTFAAGVVAGLRHKIEKAGQKTTVGSLAFAGGSAVLQPANPWEAPLKATLIALTCVYTASLLSNPGVYTMPLTDDFAVPFTAQEWWWALRDGYMFSMLSEFAKHGGLMQVPTLADADAVLPFTAQEWVWAARDGYLSDMAGEFAKHGGLMVGNTGAVDQAAMMPMAAQSAQVSTLAAAEAVVPFTAQEWFWATRDGYLPDMMGEFTKHGGFMVSNTGAVDQATMVPIAAQSAQVSTLAEAEAVVPFTAQEWLWATRDGYLPDMMGEFTKHGGFMVTDASAVDEAVMGPMTAQEWMWSARDGYLGNAISHVFRNGGL